MTSVVWRQERVLTVGAAAPRHRRVAFLAFLLGFGALLRAADVVATSFDVQQLLWYAVTVLALVSYAALRLPASHALVVLGAPLVLLLVLASASVLWSDVAATSAVDVLTLSATIFLGMYAATALPPRDLVGVVRLAATVVVGGSAALVVSRVAWAFDEEGSAIGLLTHRNSFGAVAGVALLLWLCGPRGGIVPRLFGCFLAVAGLLLSDSRTAQVATLVALAVILCDVLLEASTRLGIAAAAVLASLSIVSFVRLGGVQPLLRGAGKSGTLTGRTDLWQVLLDLGRDRPAFGHAWGSAWADGGPIADSVAFRFPGITSAHNLLLEMFLALGVAGVALLFAVLLRGFVVASPRNGVPSHLRRCTIALLAFMAVRGVTESGFPSKNSALTMVFVAFVGSLALLRASRTGESDLRSNQTAPVAGGVATHR